MFIRNRILFVAADEMKKRGVKFTMNNLAKRLRLSKASLYRHFDSKNELIGNIIAITIEDCHEQEKVIYSNGRLSVTDKIRAVIQIEPKVFGAIYSRNLYEDLRDYYPDEWNLVAEFQKKQLNHLMAFIVQNIENKTLRPVNILVLRQIIISTTSDLFSFRFLEKNEMTQAETLAALADIVIGSLLPRN